MFACVMIYFYLPTETEETTTSQQVSNIQDSDVNQKIGE